MLSYIDSQYSNTLTFLKELVEQNSFTENPAGVNKVQELLQAKLLDLSMQVERIPRDGKGDALIARTDLAQKLLKTKERSQILLSGHADTVYPPNSDFKHFSDDKVNCYGPGVMDMKGGLVVMMLALQALKHKELLHQIPISVLVIPDEETGSRSSVDLLQSEAERAKAALVFEWGRSEDKIITKRRGNSFWKLSVKGVTAHSGNEHKKGANAIVQISHTISRLSALTDYKRGITVNVGTIKGGSARNVVPDRAEALFEIRMASKEDHAELLLKVEGIVKDIVVPNTKVTAKETRLSPPMQETEQARVLFKEYQSFAEQSGLKYNDVASIIGGASNANTLSYYGAPTIDGLGPFGEHAHSEREYARLDSFLPKAKNAALWLASKVL
ncbi:MAG: M20 family metallopeptidase [Deltaproteobacteria bacterium]|nr:M20 family metallopeptidase [Deltaproteobacteria bacterium]